jgi:hypothetical protein
VTGKITGSEALVQIAALPAILSIGGMIIITPAPYCLALAHNAEPRLTR